ncbi:uncharacterized protein [Arachis hypogaea]|uniref:uncharacterized protein n=1 Tax=Arachis hypogaea TaxID=3818 RepID=UPI000DEC7951|nr:uncharacterized protein LOC112717908 [Arachis hypogaea]
MKEYLGADTAVTIKVLQQPIEATYRFRLSYRKVWMAKPKSTMERTIALLKTSPIRVGDQVDESTMYFHHLFWTSPPCIKAFRHCKPLDSIDGTHLYSKYGGTLLLAIAQDENSNILSIAFALVERENAESWHNGIKAALEAPDSGWLPPHAYRDFCIRHVVAS